MLESQKLVQKCGPTSQCDVFVGPKVPTKTSSKGPGHCTLPGDNPSNMGPLTTPTKGREVGSAEPWTPTSNLKMLISAASPDIRNREKELCVDADEALDTTQDTELGEETEKLISRKNKSLGLLCHRFLARYPDQPNPALNNDICLDFVATELNVERRRIYDIMNVLESLHMVSRFAKNRYTWHGRTNLTRTLAILKQVGEENRYKQQMQQIRQRVLDQLANFDEEEEKENQEAAAKLEAEEPVQKELLFIELPGVEFRAASVNSRKDKSLRVMSQKFVMLFLVSEPRLVSLEAAAKILIGEDHVADQDTSKFKTKVRRLYDIANVLQSLKLIQKVHVTEQWGRKPAFQWIGPVELPKVKDQVSAAFSRPSAVVSRVLEPRGSVGNCTKNLFSSPPGKCSFTRHPSLIKMAKSIQDDRRKINSAPSSPLKNDLGESSSRDFPSKMAQLAAICKIQLDQQTEKRGSTDHPGRASAKLSEAPAQIHEPVVGHTPSLPVPVAGAMSYIPAHSSPLIPVLLPQQPGSGPFAVYLHPPALKLRPPARPQPTSLAVRSMTFEDKIGHSPTGAPPAATKRQRSDAEGEGSPSKARRCDSGYKDTSPTMCDIHRRLQHHRRLQSRRPPPRALHLDPEFVNTPGGAAAGSAPPMEQSVETFLETEDKLGGSDGEAGLTPLRAVPLTPGHMHAETLVPAGYLIPISQQPLLSYKDLQGATVETSEATTYNIYKTPTAGSRPPTALEFTPTGLHLHAAASPLQRVHSPSPAILNFTLQNLGLIAAGPGAAYAHPQTPDRGEGLTSPLLGLQQRGMVFVKPMSPHAAPGQPLTLISMQQPVMTTPKGAGLPQHSFFHTPVSLSPLATVVTSGGVQAGAPKSVHIPQRKLDVSPGCKATPY